MPAVPPLDEPAAYAAWRERKIAGYPRSADELVVEVRDPRRLDRIERDAIADRLRRANMAVYASACGEFEDKEIPRALGRQFGLERLDPNWLADDDGVSSIAAREGEAHGEFIPYTDRAIRWHTDGYYNPPERCIRAFVLHCVRSAAEGGKSLLLDHEIAYLMLRDENPDWVRALALAPQSAAEWCNRGAALHDLGRYSQAVESFDRAIALQPGFAEAHYNRGNALAQLDRHADALASYDRALALKPDYADALSNRANALDQLGRLAPALESVERTLAVNRNHLGALITRAVILRKLGRSEDALASCERALALKPDDGKALTVRGDVLIDLERFDEALANLDREIARAPDAAGPKWNKSLVCLGLGRFREGWPLYEYRWAGAKGLVPRAYPQPRWNGERLAGTLLAWSEQGLGDEILHSSMLPDLMVCTGPIVLEVEPRLVRLFARSFPALKVIGLKPDLYGGAADAQIPLGSLGGYFRTGWEAFPHRDRGYLVADAGRAKALRARLAHDGRRVVGVSWISKAPFGGQSKSAKLHDFAALLRLPGFRFVDLQYGDTSAERAQLRKELGAEVERLPDIDTMNDIDGLAALITACDAVVTVSNTTAHLAGALGVPTWVMVPHGHARIWYWFRDRPDSPWYPRVRVHRQNRAQPWAELIAHVAEEVSESV